MTTTDTMTMAGMMTGAIREPSAEPDSQRQYDERQRQLDERRRQLDERQRQLDRDRRQLESDQRRLDDSYRSPRGGQRLIQRYFHPVIARFETCRQRVIHHPDVKLVADMGEDHPRTANDWLRLRTVFRSLWLRGVCARGS